MSGKRNPSAKIVQIAFDKKVGESHPRSLNLLLSPSSLFGLNFSLKDGSSNKANFPIEI